MSSSIYDKYENWAGLSYLINLPVAQFPKIKLSGCNRYHNKIAQQFYFSIPFSFQNFSAPG
jgi:hypothetical protein